MQMQMPIMMSGPILVMMFGMLLALPMAMVDADEQGGGECDNMGNKHIDPII
jgi:hypothetical protein